MHIAGNLFKETCKIKAPVLLLFSKTVMKLYMWFYMLIYNYITKCWIN